MRISLTQFLNVISKTSLSKLKKIDSVASQVSCEYSPAQDYYGDLKRAVVAMHKSGHQKDYLDASLWRVNEKKLPKYLERIAKYKKWMGRKVFVWIDPPRAIYSKFGLDVVVSPELGLMVDGKLIFVKLYFNDDPIDSNSSRMICALMRKVHGTKYPGANFAVMDVKKGALKTFSSEMDEDFIDLLNFELQYISGLLQKRAA